MVPTMNIAIVGCGKHALRFHMPSFIRLNKEVTIIGVYDRDLKKAKYLSKK